MKYGVWVSFSGCAHYEVEADNADEARDKAIEEADVYDCYEWDFNADEPEELY